ncbi:MAG: TRAP transporter TatT component family protein [Pseudomonadota bacterium]
MKKIRNVFDHNCHPRFPGCATISHLVAAGFSLRILTRAKARGYIERPIVRMNDKSVIFSLSIMIILTLLLTSCSLKQRVTGLVGVVSWDGQSAIERESEVDLVRSSFFPLVKSMEVLQSGSPNDRLYLTLLSKAYGEFAFGFLEEDLIKFKGNPKEYDKAFHLADTFYKRGLDYSMRAMRTKKGYRDGLDSSPMDFAKALKSAGKKDLPLLFWTAFCWGNWINLHKDEPSAIIEVPKVTELINRVIEIDPNYHFGSGYAFLGVIDASRPAMLGGNTQKAKESFEKSIELSDKYLFNKVLYAQFYAVAAQDKALFERLLNEVMETPDNIFPEQELSNRLAKRRAKVLLEGKRNYF